MRVFFKDDTLKISNYGGGGPRGYRKLDPAITSAIIGINFKNYLIKQDNLFNMACLNHSAKCFVLKGFNDLSSIGYAMDPEVIKKEERVSQAKLSETMNKLCNEARRGISKLNKN
jgi:hypothetical protein